MIGRSTHRSPAAPDVSWLPDRHLPVAATLAHADQLFSRLTEVLFAYQAAPAGTIGLAEVRHGSVTRTTVTSVVSLPRAVPLLAADVLTTLRAAVEHTLYAEVEHSNRRPLTEAEARSVEMPAALTADDFGRWVAGRAKRAPKPLQSGSALLERVRALQPYQRQTSPGEHPMALLAAHSNVVKHRMPAVAALRLAMIRPDAGTLLDPRVKIPNPVEGPLTVGDVLAETPVGVRVPVDLFPTVGLNRPGTDRWPVLVKELDDIARWVRTQAVPILITGTADVDPLPASFAIDQGHDDERAAIGAGSYVTAEERYKLRIGAAVVRVDLPELLAQRPDHPDRELIDRWVDNLADDELLERMSRLRAGYSAVAVTRNIRVIDQMLEEVRTFDANEPSG